mmetsp:Transcript_16914/g.23191  ORF Transcript_16914/g.23191 Transcript_16914/m.23191 type:complete len:256 (-) Transcript_16914:64-831(-)|eukprot:CAMPEP_0185732126 /NCGR_PEP_ID=MMETSP1171-20130828/15113_1 /TAXON_ID=374046 /ORGANISM="Helicotheca tamensis, Strain CCMP826" /LENGTH=255 /DNA_ID=CAMNT_0028401537 /DNA_START=1 /DNA_END=768 /DNA_ORIENTATION=-
MLRRSLVTYLALTFIVFAYDAVPLSVRPTNRRTWFQSTGAPIVSSIAAALTHPFPSPATLIVGVSTRPTIKAWPDLKFLVPIYQLGTSLDVLANLLEPNQGAAGLRLASNLVERFFGGGFLSNKSIYRGLCTVYAQEVQYDDADKDRIREDRLAYIADCDMTLAAMEAMRKPLKRLVAEGANQASPDVTSSLEDARAGVRKFLSRVPPEDVERVERFVVAVAAADVNRNGRVEGSEVDFLSPDDRELYKTVGDLL